MRRLGLQLRHTLWDMTPRDHRQSARDFRRRQVVSAVVVVIGALVLAFALGRTATGSAQFYGATLLLAVVWTVGAFASGPIHLGRVGLDETVAARPILQPILVGLGLSLVFVAGAFIVRVLPPLDLGPLGALDLAHQVRKVLGYAGEGSNAPLLLLVTVLNGIAEELFFRGALFAAIGVRHPVLISTVVYGLATVPGGNPVLVFAAVVLGAVVGLQRRAGGGVLAPILTHITWSTAMLFGLPPIFAGTI
jgi:membrane protease YdiL (CAAX protease family)